MVKVKRSTHKQAADYCKKDGIFVEKGELPLSGGEATKCVWDEAKLLAMQGKLLEINSRIFVTQLNHLEAIRDRYGSLVPPFVNDRREHTGIWIWGESGLGKSEGVAEMFPNAYRKSLCHLWNDYRGEDIVVLDEMNPKFLEKIADSLKLWTDHREFRVRKLYGTAMAHVRHFIIISNWSPIECCNQATMLQHQQYWPIRNRFRSVHVTEKWDVRDPQFFSKENLLRYPLPLSEDTTD